MMQLPLDDLESKVQDPEVSLESTFHGQYCINDPCAFSRSDHEFIMTMMMMIRKRIIMIIIMMMMTKRIIMKMMIRKRTIMIMITMRMMMIMILTRYDIYDTALLSSARPTFISCNGNFKNSFQHLSSKSSQFLSFLSYLVFFSFHTIETNSNVRCLSCTIK